MIFYMVWFHGLKLGFEYIPELGSGGTIVLEVACFRAVIIFDNSKEPDAVA